jgi:hypothetical protein
MMFSQLAPKYFGLRKFLLVQFGEIISSCPSIFGTLKIFGRSKIFKVPFEYAAIQLTWGIFMFDTRLPGRRASDAVVCAVLLFIFEWCIMGRKAVLPQESSHSARGKSKSEGCMRGKGFSIYRGTSVIDQKPKVFEASPYVFPAVS